MDDKRISQSPLNDQTLVVKPGPILDNTNAHEMVGVITEAQKRGYRYIIVDMTDLEFLSSAGVGSILGTVDTSRQAGGDIILCNVSATILHVFNVLDLAEYLTIRQTEADAAQLCGSAS